MENFLLIEYLQNFGDNIFIINSESSGAAFTSIYDIDETFYLKDTNNILKDITQKDFTKILLENKL